MKTDDLVEILKVYAGIRGCDKLYAMLTGQLTVQKYLEGVIEGTCQDLTKQRKKLSDLADDKILSKSITSEKIGDLERVQAFAQGYLAATGGKRSEG